MTQGVLRHAENRTGRTVTMVTCQRRRAVPEVFATAELEGVVAVVVITKQREPVDAPEVGDQWMECQKFAMGVTFLPVCRPKVPSGVSTP